MNILIKSEVFVPRVGGIENHVYNLAKGLVRNGYQVTVISPAWPNNTSRGLQIMDGICVYRTWNFGENLLGWLLSTLFSIPRVVSEAKKADILHTHTIFSMLPCIVGKLIFKKKHVLTLHHSRFLKAAKKKWVRPIFKKMLGNADFVLAASKELEETAIAINPGITSQPLINAIDTNLFKPQPGVLKPKRDEKILICPRRLVEKNGVEYLVRAMPMILSEIDAALFLVGDGPLREQLEKLSSELGVSENTHFIGAVENREMPGYLCSADVVILPSLMEGTPLAGMEALSCGRPVAGSNVGGIPEIVSEETGVLFEPGNSIDLAQKVVKFLKENDTKKVWAVNRQKVEKNWSLAQFIELHKEIYQCLMNEESDRL